MKGLHDFAPHRIVGLDLLGTYSVYNILAPKVLSLEINVPIYVVDIIYGTLALCTILNDIKISHLFIINECNILISFPNSFLRLVPGFNCNAKYKCMA